MRSFDPAARRPRRDTPLENLFILKTDEGDDAGPVYARIDGALYLMAFSNVARAQEARARLGVGDARPFYVCAANRERVIGELRAADAKGYIVDYDPASDTYRNAGAIPPMMAA